MTSQHLHWASHSPPVLLPFTAYNDRGLLII
jgi:hypothetical protein